MCTSLLQRRELRIPGDLEGSGPSKLGHYRPHHIGKEGSKDQHLGFDGLYMSEFFQHLWNKIIFNMKLQHLSCPRDSLMSTYNSLRCGNPVYTLDRRARHSVHINLRHTKQLFDCIYLCLNSQHRDCSQGFFRSRLHHFVNRQGITASNLRKHHRSLLNMVCSRVTRLCLNYLGNNHRMKWVVFQHLDRRLVSSKKELFDFELPDFWWGLVPDLQLQKLRE